MTGKRDPATIEYIKTLSQSDEEKLEKELKVISENNNSSSINSNYSYWYIKINEESTRVNIDLQAQVLNNYL